MKLGIDIGSTTIKAVVIDSDGEILFKKYKRHMSEILKNLSHLIDEVFNFVGNQDVNIVITGSGGLGISKFLGIKFEQEVVACSKAVDKIIPDTDVVIELGGEDAKITFYGDSIEQRMNGTCAGGTGAFIDQMALLLNTDALGLNESSKNYKTIYPIAARCGVFAKTDIQPLINEGVSLEDLSVSIFQAVVNQTISGLACGRQIKGKIAFLGGPLTFLPELRKRFIETLNIEEDNVIFPSDSQYFVAIGAALLSKQYNTHKLKKIKNILENNEILSTKDTKSMKRLFENDDEYKEFKSRHEKNKVKRNTLTDCEGALFLGIDAGSTTTKVVLIDKKNNLVYSNYKNNEGKPLETTKNILEDIYSKLPNNTYISYSGVTGYGEELLKNAFNIDIGEIETMAHYKAAKAFSNKVDFILDIGGQDMKCMKIKDGAIYSIMLNEACSSGCGSFIETYAKSVDLTVEEFAKKGLLAKNPVDLGTRCTVFMNSKVKQSQKEGATISDISSGLSYSVVKNALYKVMKLRNIEDIGNNIVVQGGTFYNESILRALELILNKEVICPDISGIMGAYGMALIAKEKNSNIQKSSIINAHDLRNFKYNNLNKRCGLCENKCILTINEFSNGKKFITGNRCEKGIGKKFTKVEIPNLYEYKYKRIFDYKPLEGNFIKEIGIPRALNMYENYPFWYTFFKELNFKIILSDKTTKNMYEKGMDTISSDTLCYPAKLVNGHIKNLIEKNVKTIFYPSINYELKENDNAQNHYNCPIVATYPEVIKNNMDDILCQNKIDFINPFLPYDDDNALARELSKVMIKFGIQKKQILKAIKKARIENENFRNDIKKAGEEAIEYAKEHNKKVIVLSGRPYHIDPEINHGIDKLITSFDMVVVTEDSIAHMADLNEPLRVLDQWMYHSRLYKAASYVNKNTNIELIQLSSFGCGLDAITSDQVEEILKNSNKLYTSLKIDEGINLGAIKIRIRSLKAAIEERGKSAINERRNLTKKTIKKFSKEMKKNYTILVPQMSPIHFQFIESLMKSEGYKVQVLPSVDSNALEEGLRYINNDACYPSIVTLGQIISEIKSGKHDLKNIAIFMSQTGGGCRASNYVSLLRKALEDMNLDFIPVISFNMSGIEKNSGFKITISMLKKFIIAILYGDLLMKLINATSPYEKNIGETNQVQKKWIYKIKKNIINGNKKEFKKNINEIVIDFEKISTNNLLKPKIGIVGEILVKYHPNANNDIVKIIEEEGGEAVALDLMDFFLYGMYSKEFNNKYLVCKKSTLFKSRLLMSYIENYRKPIREILEKSKYISSGSIKEIAKKASKIISLGNQCGEGWLLTGEMIELIDNGVSNIVCLQPFGCLPNHVTGKGTLKALRKYNKKANIVPIDYDPGASSVNQLNRIKLMMATAHKNMK